LDDDELNGRAIKCISMLLQSMPIKHNYKVIFMTRPIEEVVVSQRAMVNRLATNGTQLDSEQLERVFAAHRNETMSWLSRVPHMEVLEIDYPALVSDPPSVIARLVEFLGSDRLPASDKMATVVDASLYRRKESVA
jgi:hypothetical protein